MHAITIVQDVLRKGCPLPHIHKARLESLCDVVRAALSASSHTLSNLARALDTKRVRAESTRCVSQSTQSDAAAWLCPS